MRPEENYPEYMEEHVLPCILPHREERYLSREPGQPIYCAFYTADVHASGRHEGNSGGDAGNRSVSGANGIILISHGFTETADKYFEVICYFLKAGYHVCIPEHCGHGRSYRLADGDFSLVYTDSWQRYVNDLSFVAQAAKSYWEQGLPLFLFAHSMGGGIGAALAAREPRLFQKIVLSSPMICPCTGQVPWAVSKLIVAVMCAVGKEKSYVIGQHAYDGKETFEESFATSPARHAWYKSRTDAEPLYQTYAASYGWLREAIRLNRFLINDAWKQISAPLLLVQAEKETVVSKEQQELFIRRLARARQLPDPVTDTHSAPDSAQASPSTVRFVRIPGAKHEIFRSDDATVEKFLKLCLDMFDPRQTGAVRTADAPQNRPSPQIP
ncbi:MAG: alpha/beta hydrolase [Lachnospiraceae bacterium]|nr:alpha/beta hydrolase [Lachnospiraceae bacterium]